MVDTLLKENEKKVLEEIFLRLKIGKVVLVEDQRTEGLISLFFSLCRRVNADSLKGLEFLSPVDFEVAEPHVISQIQSLWDRWSDVEKAANYGTLAGMVQPNGDQDERGKDDHSSVLLLKHLIQDELGLDYEELSLSQWKNEKGELLKPRNARRTLFLFDRDFRNDKGTGNEGLTLIHEVLQVKDVVCGLITHTVAPGNEGAECIRLSEDHKIAPRRLVVVSKQRLSQASPDIEGFVRQLRRMLLNGRCMELKKDALSIFRKALIASSKKIDELDVDVFDKIVFQSSINEGIWEADTLFRLFSLYLNRESRAISRSTARFVKRVSLVRQVSTIPQLPDSSEMHATKLRVKAIQRMELYEPGDLVNGHCLPLECGDIFEIKEQGKPARQYLLMNQACALMVRKEGMRANDFDKGFVCLVRIKKFQKRENERPGDTSVDSSDPLVAEKHKPQLKDSQVEMPFYDGSSLDKYFVDFHAIQYVPVSVVDLCCLNKAGRAQIKIDQEFPDDLIIPWKLHAKYLNKEFKKAFNKVIRLKGLLNSVRGINPDEIAKLGRKKCVSHPEIQFTVKRDGEIDFPITRVERLRYPFSGEILQQFSAFASRHGFDHFFLRPEELEIQQEEESPLVVSTASESPSEEVEEVREVTEEPVMNAG